MCLVSPGGGSYDTLMELIKSEEIVYNDFRFFLGYSGWEVDQLESELAHNSWIICRNVQPEHIF